MISRFTIAMMTGGEDALTENGLMSRRLILLVLLGLMLLLSVLILKNIKKKRNRIITAIILSAVLIFEASGVIPYLQGNIHVPLEYVGSAETTRNDPQNNKVKWFTNCSAPFESKPSKEELEGWLKCDLANIALNDEEYTYLFVLYYKDVDLFYNIWSESNYYTDCWIGRLEAAGAPAKNTIYIFRFPRKVIVPAEPHDIVWWEEPVD